MILFIVSYRVCVAPPIVEIQENQFHRPTDQVSFFLDALLTEA